MQYKTFDEVVADYVGKKIKSIKFDNNIKHNEDSITLAFEDDSSITMWDGGQSCCEYRHTSTDDDINGVVGGTLVNVEIADASDGESSNGYKESHECQFLRIITDIYTITFVNHNEHNGYYGGFDMAIKENK